MTTAPRIIPCLLLKGRGLVKGVRFEKHTYVGDPINTVQIFNSKEVDELLFLDITATAERRSVPIELIQTIADQCLMPFGVGGGIRSVQDIRRILAAGAEKVCLCTGAFEIPGLIRDSSRIFGSQAILVSIDVKKSLFGQLKVYIRNGSKSIKMDVLEAARWVEAEGAGEILLNSIDRDGSMQGYDIELIKSVAAAVSIPVIACGGAGKYGDLKTALFEGRADAAAAGSLFVFHGRKRAVLVNYPDEEQISDIRHLQNHSFAEWGHT